MRQWLNRYRSWHTRQVRSTRMCCTCSARAVVRGSLPVCVVLAVTGSLSTASTTCAGTAAVCANLCTPSATLEVSADTSAIRKLNLCCVRGRRLRHGRHIQAVAFSGICSLLNTHPSFAHGGSNMIAVLACDAAKKRGRAALLTHTSKYEKTHD